MFVCLCMWCDTYDCALINSDMAHRMVSVPDHMYLGSSVRSKEKSDLILQFYNFMHLILVGLQAAKPHTLQLHFKRAAQRLHEKNSPIFCEIFFSLYFSVTFITSSLNWLNVDVGHHIEFPTRTTIGICIECLVWRAVPHLLSLMENKKRSTTESDLHKTRASPLVCTQNNVHSNVNWNGLKI